MHKGSPLVDVHSLLVARNGPEVYVQSTSATKQKNLKESKFAKGWICILDITHMKVIEI